MHAHDMSVSCAACSHAYADSALFCPNCGRPKTREPTHDALVGTLLGERFQVQAFLGQGASGTLYRAEHVTLRRRVAIKVLHAELSRDDLAVERFRREATTVADIDNEHILEIHDFGRTPDGRLYLAMELLDGEALDAVLAREKTLSIERVADVLIQTGEALMEAHAIGYVHRDLRPQNLFIATRRGKANFVKLLDFGLAKLVDTDAAVASTNLGMTFGDPRYMSPEQARGERIDRRADIYQLGCVAYEMLTGAPPFAGSRVFDILTKQVSEAPQPLPSKRPGVPLWMEAAVAKMLAKAPEDRFATTSRMVDALRRGLETGEVMGDAVARRPESVPPPSVSRVMQKFGVTVDGMAPASPPPGLATSEKATPRPPVQDSVDLLRKRTGTPRVGVPAVGDSNAALPATAKRAPEDSNPGESQAWYDEGDRGGARDFDDEPAVSRAKRRVALLPSASSSDFSDELPKERRWGRAAIVIGALILVGGALALTRGVDGPSEPVKAPIATPALTPDAAPASIIEDGGIALVADAPAATVAVKTSGGGTNRGTGNITRGGVQAPRTGDASGTFPFPVLGSNPGAGSTPATPGTPTTSGGTTVVIQPATPVTPPPGPATPYDPAPAHPDRTPDPSVNGGGPLDPYNSGGGSTEVPQGASPPQQADALASRGTQQLSDGDTSGAAASFKKALELDPGHAAATVGMGEIALRQGLFGDAIVHLKKASRLSPRSSRVWTLLGEAYLHSGNASEATSAFKKALQLDPENARAREGFNDASGRVTPPSE